jgi:5-methyltetrahydropteroyltriglutamate--homocysteine methyltransferase
LRCKTRLAATDAGFILQLDLAATSTHNPQAIEERVEVVNHALRDIPEEQVRYHHCWGSMNHSHTTDVPWILWKDVRLPAGKILIPGLISHQTNVVEHPELVAWRLRLYAERVGKEKRHRRSDCGFAQHWDAIRVHPTVQWAKLRSLVDGATLASQELWGH